MKLNLRRISGIVVRHLMTWRRDVESIAESFWWPVLDLLIWGMTSYYLRNQQGVFAQFTNFVIGGSILWMFVYRSQQETGFAFLREFWDRNLLNVFITPLTMGEFIAASILLGLIKLTISAILLIGLSYALFAFNIFELEWYMVPYILNLLFVGWWASLIITGLVIQYGYRIQALVWTLLSIIYPFSAVMYPVSTMPVWMQFVSRVLPTSYIFEGMRQVLTVGTGDSKGLITAVVLNLFYTVLSVIYFQRSYRSALRTGMLVKFS